MNELELLKIELIRLKQVIAMRNRQIKSLRGVVKAYRQFARDMADKKIEDIDSNT